MVIQFLIFALVIQIQSKLLRQVKDVPRHLLHSEYYQRLLAETDSKICYGVMFDAGSSGTRVYVYSWPCRANDTMVDIDVHEDSINQKAKPGISAFAANITGIPSYLDPLITFAQLHVPLALAQYTPILMGGTAGLRLLPQEQQDSIMKEVRSIFENTLFLFVDDQWARVISGQDEGAYMWMSVNYLLGLLEPADIDKTVLTIDVGGASTQIAFRPTYTIPNIEADNLTIPNFKTFDIYTTTYLGYGNDQARISVLQNSIQAGSNTITTPCYHKDYTAPYELDKTKTIVGTGQYEQCLVFIDQLLNATGLCAYGVQCSINGMFQPTVDLNMQIYGTGSVYQAASFYNLENFTVTN